MDKRRKLQKKKNTSNIEGKSKETVKKSKVGLILKVLGFSILGIFIYFAIISTSGNGKTSVFQNLDTLKQDKKPYLVVIRDDFTPVSIENKKVIDRIINKANDSMMVFDISYNPKESSRTAKYFIDKYNIECLPVFVLCDENGDLIDSYYLPFSEKQILDGVEKVRESSVKNEKS